MKALIKSQEKTIQDIATPLLIGRNDVDVTINGFHKIHNKHYLLQLGISNILKDNYRLFIKGWYLTLIKSEPKEITKPVYIHHMNWGDFNSQNYEIMKSVDIWLPGDNFYIVRHFSVPKDKLLKVFLGDMTMN